MIKFEIVAIYLLDFVCDENILYNFIVNCEMIENKFEICWKYCWENIFLCTNVIDNVVYTIMQIVG